MIKNEQNLIKFEFESRKKRTKRITFTVRLESKELINIRMIQEKYQINKSEAIRRLINDNYV